MNADLAEFSQSAFGSCGWRVPRRSTSRLVNAGNRHQVTSIGGQNPVQPSKRLSQNRGK